jgi:hypothetical protein
MLVAMSPDTHQCQQIPNLANNIETISSIDSLLVCMSIDGHVHIMDREIRQVKIKRAGYHFLNLSVIDNYIIVYALNEQTNTGLYLLYTADMKYRDELTVKEGKYYFF